MHALRSWRLFCTQAPRNGITNFLVSAPNLPPTLPFSRKTGRRVTKNWIYAFLAVPAYASCEALKASPGKASFAGVWIRDDQATDMNAYERQLDVMQITGIKKQTALIFIKGLELTETADGVKIQFLTAVPYFKVTEEVVFGTTVDQPRRDKRRGTQRATASRQASGMVVDMKWEEPLAGTLKECYKFDNNTLVVESKVVIQENSASAKLVYRRQGMA